MYYTSLVLVNARMLQFAVLVNFWVLPGLGQYYHWYFHLYYQAWHKLGLYINVTNLLLSLLMARTKQTNRHTSKTEKYNYPQRQAPLTVPTNMSTSSQREAAKRRRSSGGGKGKNNFSSLFEGG